MLVREAIGFGRLRKVFAVRQVRIRVGLEHERTALFVHPHVDAGVAVQVERAVRALGDALDPLRHGRVELRRVGHDPVLLLVLRAPLHALGGDVPAVVRHLRERHLPHREDVEPIVAEHADIEFAAFDELLDDGGGAEAVVDELDAPGELLGVLHDRGLRDAGRRFEEQRLHDQRKVHVLRRARACGRGGRP